MKTVAKWRSERLQREVTMVRWGTYGQPVLVFPTAGGDAEEIERMHLVGAVGGLIETGKIKVYSCDSVAGAALLAREGSAQHQMWLQNQFQHYVRHEVVAAIRSDCKADLEVWAAGASIGAFHAIAVVCRWPDVFARACAMSGTYDLRRFYDTGEFTDDFWVSSPVHFVPTLAGVHLEKLRERYLVMPSGEGRAEDIGESFRMADALGKQGVPNRVDNWGPSFHHDWPTWRQMLPKFLEEWTRAT
ncbi:MAG TPA: alpha/beta hydrolase-fold protein [Kofleriaceae bacterium]|nr:alpha/beta hydrolase-fold protein [Kofleriaceae bacterium]